MYFLRSSVTLMDIHNCDDMLKRIVIFMGVPVFSGILLFPLFYWLKVGRQ